MQYKYQLLIFRFRFTSRRWLKTVSSMYWIVKNTSTFSALISNEERQSKQSDIGNRNEKGCFSSTFPLPCFWWNACYVENVPNQLAGHQPLRLELIVFDNDRLCGFDFEYAKDNHFPL